MGSQLMHASIPTSQAFSLIFVFFFPFFLFFFLVLPLFLFVIVDPPSLFTATTFYTVCHEIIYHFYPSPAFGPSPTTIALCWLHHTSFSEKNGLSYLSPLFILTTLI